VADFARKTKKLRKQLFFEKKHQKTFVHYGLWRGR